MTAVGDVIEFAPLRHYYTVPDPLGTCDGCVAKRDSVMCSAMPDCSTGISIVFQRLRLTVGDVLSGHLHDGREVIRGEIVGLEQHTKSFTEKPYKVRWTDGAGVHIDWVGPQDFKSIKFFKRGAEHA